MLVAFSIELNSTEELKKRLPEIAALQDKYNADITIHLSSSVSIETDKLN